MYVIVVLITEGNSGILHNGLYLYSLDVSMRYSPYAFNPKGGFKMLYALSVPTVLLGVIFLSLKAQERLEEKLFQKYKREDNSSPRASYESALEKSWEITSIRLLVASIFLSIYLCVLESFLG